MRTPLQVLKTFVSHRGLKILLTLFCAVTVHAAFAQDAVKGIVSDEKGEPIVGASVIVKGTTRGVSTGVSGDFSIDAPSSAVLQISYMGYTSQEIPVGNRTFLEIKLQPDTQIIDDVVVVGYGSQKKVNLTGAVSAVSQNTAMSGKSGATLRVRGLGTTNNANPLIVVDGMPDVDINRLNMNDIESISVLKDASSSAVYGSRAANGVILITTKGGSSTKTQPKINFTGSWAVSKPIHAFELMSNYPRAISTMIQASEAGGSVSRFRYGAVEEWAAKSFIDPLRYPNTDWMDITSRNGMLRNYNLSASGGDGRSSFYISGGIMDEQGVHMTTDYTRYNARFNYTYKIRKNILVGAKFDGSWTKWNYARDDGWYVNSGSGGLISAVAGVTPYDPETDRYGGAMMYGEDATIFNPYREYKNSIVDRNAQDMFGGVNVEWEPLKGLKVAVDYNLTYLNQIVKNYDMPHSEWNMQTGNAVRVLVGPSAGVNDNLKTGYRTLLNSRATYQRSFGKHDISALFLYSEEYARERTNYAGRDSRLNPNLTEVSATLKETYRAEGNSTAWGLRSYIGRLNYAFDSRYLLEASFRYDGSSRFVPGFQYGFFPSMSVGWRFTEEKFLKGLTKVVNNGKFRFSYGGLGNNSGVGNYEQKETLTDSPYLVGGKVAMGFVNKKLINQTLSWETTNVLNIGLDLGFLKNRLTAELDYYNRRTHGMLRPDQLSSLLSGAYSAPKTNIGIMYNKGVELNLTWRDQVKDFEYSVNFNLSYNANQLKRWNSYLGKGNVFIDMPYQFVYPQVNYDGVVQTWQQIYDAPWQAGGSAPGDLLLKDLNGDGKIDGEDKLAMPNFMQYMPTTTFGLNASFAWKGIDLVMLWSGSSGRKDYWNNHFNKATLMAAAQSISMDQYYDSWSYDNRGGSLPRLVTGSRGINNAASTFWLDNMAYLRLKNLQIGYSLPKKWLDHIKISQVRVYLSGENLWTITKYRGIDPEKALTGTGSENDVYPMLRTISFGINITI